MALLCSGGEASGPSVQSEPVHGAGNEVGTAAESLDRARQEETPQPLPAGAPAGIDRQSRRALVLVDAPDLAGIITAALERLRVHALHERRADRALHLIEMQRPDLIVLDADLPAGDGWRLLETILSCPGSGRPPVILLAGHAPDERRLGRLPDVRACLVKPATVDEVARAVESILRSRPEGSRMADGGRAVDEPEGAESATSSPAGEPEVRP